MSAVSPNPAASSSGSAGPAAASPVQRRVEAYWAEPFRVTPEDLPGQVREIIRYATLAPSAHNTQPWKFGVEGHTVRLFPDLSRRMPYSDPDDRELFISLGCAVEHFVRAARQAGYETEVEYRLTGSPDECILLTLRPTGVREEDPLFQVIPLRHHNRRPYEDRVIPAADLNRLEQLPLERGVSLQVLTGRKDVEQIVEIIRAANDILLRNRGFVDELMSWVRFSDASIARHLDGLSARAIGAPTIPDRLGRLIVGRLISPAMQSNMDAKKIRTAQAIMVVFAEGTEREDWLDVGRSFARVMLCATTLGFWGAHLNQNWGQPYTRDPLLGYMGIDERHPQVVLRLGYAAPLPHAPRRPVEQVLI
jgi:hypothetical protein